MTEITDHRTFQYQLGEEPVHSELAVLDDDPRVLVFQRPTRRNAQVIVVYSDTKLESHALPQQIVYHSPDGFEWGYEGSGPGDLALNILAFFLESKKEAWRLHQDFKSDFIAKMPFHGGSITALQIRDWVAGKYAAEKPKVIAQMVPEGKQAVGRLVGDLPDSAR